MRLRKTRRGFAIAAAAIFVCAHGALATPLPASFGYPGDTFDWPAPAGVPGYGWLVDLTGVTTFPTTVVDFTVTNTTFAPLTVTTFQIFGNCSGAEPSDAAYADFELLLDGTQTPWTAVEDGPCLYHNYLNFALPVGPTQFTVTLTGDRETAPLVYADVRFGNVIPAVPLPPTAALLFGATSVLLWAGRRRRGD